MTVEIKGYEVEVDEGDLHIVEEHGWCLLCGYSFDHGFIYFQASIGGSHSLLHRMIMKAGKGQAIDHADGNTLNNRKDNLRFADATQNNYNSVKRKNNKSGFKGVYWKKDNRKWIAQIRHRGKCHILGRFDNPLEASEAYQEAALIYAREFARW
jgi:hypothetical protein